MSRRRGQPISRSSGSSTWYCSANLRRYGTAQIAMTSSRSMPIFIGSSTLRPQASGAGGNAARQSPRRITALKTQCAAIVLASEPVARRRIAMSAPPARSTTTNPNTAGTKSGDGGAGDQRGVQRADDRSAHRAMPPEAQRLRVQTEGAGRGNLDEHEGRAGQQERPAPAGKARARTDQRRHEVAPDDEERSEEPDHATRRPSIARPSIA